MSMSDQGCDNQPINQCERHANVETVSGLQVGSGCRATRLQVDRVCGLQAAGGGWKAVGLLGLIIIQWKCITGFEFCAEFFFIRGWRHAF